ncbi:aminoacylase-1-like isoform X2 [Helicoverpa zea]|uniref:aminoacylase-1-like isoform X2 n=1 Tax=Helicoverpa zea TaxID=7113 RepID=UPI001F58738A|nr:aminoacylase-1-like isoform X2 [Helicoverpa zea]
MKKDATMIGIVSIVLAVLQVSSAACDANSYANSTPIELLQAYIQINTTTYNDLTPAVEFWTALAELADVSIETHELVEGFPILVLKWPGTDSSQPSIMLNSHMDVVPASFEDGWKYGPFLGHIDDDGVIWGRGTQDMKSVSIQYYSALRRLKENNVTLLRDIYMTLMPDEEVGAESGMIPFLQTDTFASMNVGVELDEGSPFPAPMIALFYQDKVVWQIQVTCHGVSGHGSSFPATNDTATGKCNNVVNRLFQFRDEQYEIAATALPTAAGGYTSINLNIVSGGTANNVVPSEISLVFDIRLSTTLNEEAFDAQLREWISEAGDNITLTYILKNQQSPATVANSTNPYYVAITEAAEDLGITIVPTLPPGSTDARHVRNAGYPAFGFSPMPNTEMLLHAVDEHLAVSVFNDGIDTYEEIITRLANIPANSTATDQSVYLYSTA